jgi:hypothetical protein
MNKHLKYLVVIGSGVVILVALGYWVQTSRRSQDPVSSEPELQPLPAPLQAPATTPHTVSIREISASSSNDVAPSSRRLPVAPSPVASLPSSLPAGSAAAAEDALAKLSQLNLGQGPLTQEQAAQINALLQQLAAQGAAAIPAIQKFLESNQDVNFNAIDGGQQVDVPTLRLGLIEALQAIGGAEAVQTAVETLQATTNPLEIAGLTQALEQTAPGQYRTMELTTALNTLQLASGDQWNGGDVSPIFEMLQHYGDASVVPALEQAAVKWNYYATLALAGLPNGAGVSALVTLAQDPNISSLGNGDIALRPLAQVALQYPDAAQGLVNLARQNQIPDIAWPTVIASLSGNYIQYGNQLFGSTAPSTSWSPEEVDQRIALINQLLAATSNPAAHQSLQGALASVSSRLPK